MMYRTFRIRPVTIGVLEAGCDRGTRKISHYTITYAGQLIDTALTISRATALIDEYFVQRRFPSSAKCS